MKFYICKHCGNVITRLTSSGAPISCCGEEMQLLEAGVVEAAHEKHIPVVAAEDGLVRVSVGSVVHPMTQEHFIQWVALVTERSAYLHWLQPGEAPEAVFSLAPGETVQSVYAYCNLHGLWQAAL